MPSTNEYKLRKVFHFQFLALKRTSGATSTMIMIDIFFLLTMAPHFIAISVDKIWAMTKIYNYKPSNIEQPWLKTICRIMNTGASSAKIFSNICPWILSVSRLEASFSKNCLRLGTDDVHGEISEQYFCAK